MGSEGSLGLCTRPPSQLCDTPNPTGMLDCFGTTRPPSSNGTPRVSTTRVLLRIVVVCKRIEPTLPWTAQNSIARFSR
jgi:hypothetical protein